MFQYKQIRFDKATILVGALVVCLRVNCASFIVLWICVVELTNIVAFIFVS